MEEKNITKSDEEKDLGIIIDGKLKFRQHINIQTKKANQKLGIFLHQYQTIFFSNIGNQNIFF
jgi:hypothetical protein